MYPLVTGKQMQALDRYAIEQLKISGLTLMENAGQQTVRILESEKGGLRGRSVAVVCGPGNNGGDGFVCCRALLDRGASPRCLLIGEMASLSGDAKASAQEYLTSGGEIVEVTDAGQLTSALAQSEIVIDALFGTGLSRAPAGLFAAAIETINAGDRYVVSIDVPSGVDADSGRAFEPAVRADLVVTMALPKYGHVLFPAAACTGALRVADIGIPYSVLSESADMWLLDASHVRSLLPRRPRNGHKGTFGACLLVCGSRQYSGAACLAAQAAVRSGCGLVRLAFPAGIYDVVSVAVPEAVKLPLAQTEAGTIAATALDELVAAAASSDSLAVGPGLTTQPETYGTILDLLAAVTKPVVIDADALNALAARPEMLRGLKCPAVLTPHPGEFARLAGVSPADADNDRLALSRAFSREHGVVLVLKGAPTVVAGPDGQTFVNPTGNSGLGSGGTGDVLTGLVAGLLAQGMTPEDAAITGVYLHGLTADIGAAELTEYALCATDVLRYLPAAFRKVLGTTDHTSPAGRAPLQ